MFQPFARRSLLPQPAYVCPSCVLRRTFLGPRPSTYSTYLDNPSIQDIHKSLDEAELRSLNKRRGNRAPTLFGPIEKANEAPKVPTPLQHSRSAAEKVDDNVATPPTSKGSTAKQATPEKAEADSAASKKVTPKKVKSESGAPKKATSKTGRHKRTASRKVEQKRPASKSTATEGVASGAVAPERAAEKKATPTKTVSTNAVSTRASEDARASIEAILDTAFLEAGGPIRLRSAKAVLESAPLPIASEDERHLEQTLQGKPEKSTGPPRSILSKRPRRPVRSLRLISIGARGPLRLISRPFVPKPRIRKIWSLSPERRIDVERPGYLARLKFLRAHPSGPRESSVSRNVSSSSREHLGRKVILFEPTGEGLNGEQLSLVPLDINHPPVPPLSYGLDRVLFNPGVYNLQDQRTHVYNFDPYLQTIMPVSEFNFAALKEYVTSSKDTVLSGLARDHGKRYVGSTSSMTSALSHFHFLLSNWRDINLTTLSQGFPEDYKSFTQLTRVPSAIFLKNNDGVYAIDADKAFDSSTILSTLGKSMEKLLTLETGTFERYRKSNPDAMTQEEENKSPEAFHYSTMGDFLMRSQLDAQDPRLPGTGMFDLKTRAVVSVRMDSSNYEDMKDYQIKGRFGKWESYEREYYDMMRSVFLKYSLQVRMGRMDGIFVAFHNTERIFGFQYIPLPEMDLAIHGQSNLALGDQEFKLSVDLLNKVLDKATERFPGKSIRLHLETREATDTFMYIFAEPVTDDEMLATQTRANSKIEEFKQRVLGPDDTTEVQLDKSQSHVQETKDTNNVGDDKSMFLHEKMHTTSAFDNEELDPPYIEIQDEEATPIMEGAESASIETHDQVKTTDMAASVIEVGSIPDNLSDKHESEAGQDLESLENVGAEANANDSDKEILLESYESTTGEPTTEPDVGPEHPSQDGSNQDVESELDSFRVEPTTNQSSNSQDTLRADQADPHTSLEEGVQVQELQHDGGLHNAHDSSIPDTNFEDGSFDLSVDQHVTYASQSIDLKTQDRQSKVTGDSKVDDQLDATCFTLQDVRTSEHAEFYLHHLLLTFYGDEVIRTCMGAFTQKGVWKLRPEKDGSWSPFIYFSHLRGTFWNSRQNRKAFNIIQNKPPPGYRFERFWLDGSISIATCLRRTRRGNRKIPRKPKGSPAAKSGPKSDSTSTLISRSSPDSTGNDHLQIPSPSNAELVPDSTSSGPPLTSAFPTGASADSKRIKQRSSHPKDILAMILHVQHKVNDEYVERAEGINYVGDHPNIPGMPAHGPFPDAQATNRKWTVEYQLKEIDRPSRAWQLYEMCQERRRKRFEDMDAKHQKDAENQTVDRYIEMLRKISRSGKMYKEEMERRQSEMGEKRVVGGR